MSAQSLDTGQILDDLDATRGRHADAAKRRSTRRSWRKPLKVLITQPGGDRRKIEVVTRDLSSGGLSFLYNGYLHVGTSCELQLITVDNAWVDIQGIIVRCRFVAGRVHEASLRFTKPVDESLFLSQTLSASILLVDDAEDQSRLTAHYLSKAGAKVVTANGGVRALKLVAEHDFDLILLDVEMPGVSGPQVAQTLRERGVTIPIIAYTANNDQATREECLAAGCSDVLTKPLGKTDLIDAVARYLAVEGPIVSKHAGNPEMAEFIHDFVAGLPARVQEMQGCLQSRKAQELGALARQFKVAASDDGGCGFGELSTAAEALAKALTETVDWASVEEAMHALDGLAQRVKEMSD